ncbi:5'/3'-nucleotidase SurE [Candidatus Micrarchaeota archaeon]|nr:5'/3'-nucleotidase SurE [Candidatus Micrarchaeota archaeon]
MAFILVSNDDGFAAPGIRALVRELKKKHELFIACPDRDYSWIGTSSNTKIPVKVKEKKLDGLTWRVFNSTPVDCVNISLSHLLGKKPDAIVSGINCGLNNGVAFTSGTISAAEQGAWFGLVGLAASVGFKDLKKFSVKNSKGYEFYSTAARLTARVLGALLERKKLTAGRVFNLNFPQEIIDKKIYLTFAQKVSAYPYFERKNNEFVHASSRPKVAGVEKNGDFSAFERGQISLSPLNRFETTDLKKWRWLEEKANKKQ